MARQDSKARPPHPTPTRAAHRAAPSGSALGKHELMPSRAQAAAAADGNIAKDVAETSIAATQDLGHWLSHWQRLGTQAMAAWGGALGNIEQEPSQATYFGPLAFLPFELAQRQFQTFWSFFGWVFPGRESTGRPATATADPGLDPFAATPPLWRRAWSAATDGTVAAGSADSADTTLQDGASTPVLEQMARAQSEWLALTQRWIDSAASLPLKPAD